MGLSGHLHSYLKLGLNHSNNWFHLKMIVQRPNIDTSWVTSLNQVDMPISNVKKKNGAIFRRTNQAWYIFLYVKRKRYDLAFSETSLKSLILCSLFKDIEVSYWCIFYLYIILVSKHRPSHFTNRHLFPNSSHVSSGKYSSGNISKLSRRPDSKTYFQFKQGAPSKV